MKPSLSRIGSGQDIIYWDDASSLHFEGELALVIGEDLSGTISEIEARRAIIGLTLLNDVTDRVKQTELKNSGKPWLVAKGRPTFAPIGPSIYLLPEDAEINKLTYTTSLNGTEVQHGDTSLWLWEAESIVATIARLVGLKSGDIIATGTPSGVGQLSSGDEITIHSELLGQLTNFVKTEK